MSQRRFVRPPSMATLFVDERPITPRVDSHDSPRLSSLATTTIPGSRDNSQGSNNGVGGVTGNSSNSIDEDKASSSSSNGSTGVVHKSHVAKRVLRRVVVELFSVIVTASRFTTAVSGLLFGLAYVIVTEICGMIVRFFRAALVRSHYQPRSSLDGAMRLLREARNARSRTSANAAVLEAERLIHEATLCPLETSAVDIVTQRVLSRQQEDEQAESEDDEQGAVDDNRAEPEPYKLIGDDSMSFFNDISRCLTVPHETRQSVPTYEGRVHLRERVLRDENLVAVMDELAHGDSEQLRKLARNAEVMYDNMAAKPSMTLVRFLSWFLGKMIGLFYPFGVEVDLAQLRAVQEVARRARCPLVLLPTHKSHMDYLLVTYLCFMFNLPLPHVVSGDNLNIPIIGPILRRGGAFFIRRSFVGDKLYAAVFDAYVTQLLMHGLCVECFVEGGRSRYGKLLAPKTGFLRSVVKAVRSGEVDDAFVVPISISYDRVVEGRSMTAELAGSAKKAEALVGAITGVYRLIRDAATRKLCFGRVDIGVAAPISVREFLRTRNVHRGDDPAPPPTVPSISISDSSDEAHLAALVASQPQSSLARPHSVFARTTNEIERDAKLLGYATLYHCNQTAAILPTSLVGTVLLTQYERGIPLEELVRRVNWLSHEVQSRGFKVVSQDNVTLADSIRMVIDEVLGGNHSELVKRHKNLLLLKLYNPRERLELTVLRNQLLHVFVDEAILCCALYSFEKKGATSVARGELYEKFSWLTLLLSFEFIWEPIPRATVARSRFNAALRRLEERSVLRVRLATSSDEPAVAAAGSGASSLRSSRSNITTVARAAAVSVTAADEQSSFIVPSSSNDDTDMIGVNESFTKSGVKRGTMTYLFQCSLLWAFIDTYFVASLAVLTMLPRDGSSSRQLLTLDQLVERAQKIGEQLFFQCVIDLFEAVSKETLQNAFQLFKHWSVFTLESTPAVRNLVKLTSEFDTEPQVMTLVHRVADYKKSARAYRSRRFRTRVGGDEVLDSIRIAMSVD